MRLRTLSQVDQFLSEVDRCKGGIYLTSKYGDRFNLKSKLSQFLAINAILDDQTEELELHCTENEDSNRLSHYLLAN
ncbi:MAG: polya polymerase [Lachnospiraceae bacterium]|nr:polya polymerase [Lachnospiraceae bacterium]